jgi:polyisoprenyl-phosphate glycosyltransferase
VELIPKFIEKWEQGAEMVIGVRKKNQGEGMIKRYGSFFFYKIMNLIGETKIMPSATDYRLIDKKIIKEFERFTERQRMTRGLLDWIGFRKDYIYFTTNGRNAGRPAYNTAKLVKLAFSTFVANSLFPLKLAGYLGIFITFISGLLGFFIFIEDFVLKDPFRLHFTGPAILGVIIVFLVGIILICLGLIALYIGNIHGEVINRPMYVVRKKENL